MTDQPNKYSNSYIYKIVCKDINVKNEYVGSTCDFRERYLQHKRVYNNANSNGHNLHVYMFIREHGGWDNWEMILLENCNFNDEIELRQRERHYFETLHADLNKRYPIRNKTEYEHNEEVKAYRSEQLLCACGCYYRRHDKSRHINTKIHLSNIL